MFQSFRIICVCVQNAHNSESDLSSLNKNEFKANALLDVLK